VRVVFPVYVYPRVYVRHLPDYIYLKVLVVRDDVRKLL
jgi:hypothetical protein